MERASWHDRYAAAASVWGGEPNRFIAAEFETVKPSRALDVGAGEGRNASWLAARGWDVTAVDFSAVAVNRGRQAAADQGLTVHWAVADLRDYVPDSGAFDAVIVAYLHVVPAELAAVLQRAADAPAPGGRMTPQMIIDMLRGLQIMRAERVYRPVASDGAIVEAVDTLVTARTQ